MLRSGGTLNKKGLNQLLDLVEDGSIDVVLVIDQDRLSRLDTVAWEYLKSTLRDNNVKIAEPGTLTDLANEDQEFISDIKNLIAKREKKAIVKRMMRGKRQRMREGKQQSTNRLYLQQS
ncbi:recombinase family protein [Anaerobacillus sp. HL2]|nr:recombinase family protein [Anaerobacillus sp. HL2]